MGVESVIAQVAEEFVRLVGVADQIDIEQTVHVVVEPLGAEAAATDIHTGGNGHFGERSCIIAVEQVRI